MLLLCTPGLSLGKLYVILSPTDENSFDLDGAVAVCYGRKTCAANTGHNKNIRAYGYTAQFLHDRTVALHILNWIIQAAGHKHQTI